MARATVPLPREHGAWAMVVGPALVGLAAGSIHSSDRAVPSLESGPHGSGSASPEVDAASSTLDTVLAGSCLLVALLALFCLQYVVVRQLTAKRTEPGLVRWAAIYGGVAALAGGVLVLAYDQRELLALGLVAGLYFALHVVQVRRPGRREHRALGFELLTVAVLCLGAPAGVLVGAGPGWLGSSGGGAGAPGVGATSGGTGIGATLAHLEHLAPVAAWAYGLSFAFFAGSVVHVRAIVRRLRLRSIAPAQIARSRLAIESIAWHVGLGLLLVTVGTGLLPTALTRDSVDRTLAETGLTQTTPLAQTAPLVREAPLAQTSALSQAAPLALAAALTLAFLPAIVRALTTARRLRSSDWSLRTVGLVELGCTVAFVLGAVLFFRLTA